MALVNPVAGQGAATQMWDQIAFELIGSGIDVCTVAPPNRDATIDEATAAAADGAVVVAVGGDGMFRDVVAGASKVAGTVALVPAGRGNDFATKINIPTGVVELAAMLVSGLTSTIDVLDVNGKVVPGNVYVGVDSVAARLINDHRNIAPLVLYRGAAIAAVIRWRPTLFTLEYTDAAGNDQIRVIKAHDIVIANSGRYGHGLNIVPSASLDDGMIDVMVVCHGSRRRVLSFLLAAKQGTHIRRDDVEVFRTAALTISADRDIPFGADGDEVTTLPARITIRPRALRLVIPS